MYLTSGQSTDRNVDGPERAISIIGGAFLAYKSLGRFKKNPFLAAQEAFLGAMMLHRGATGFCPLYSVLDKGSMEQGAINISESFIIDKPREELYAFWRRLENLPVFMKHLSSVEEHDEKRSHWRANLPGEILKLSWNAEITRAEKNEYIGWKSVAGSMVENAGEVTFSDAVNTSGTELTVDLRYFPPAGSLGQGVARLLNGVFESMVRHDIENFKHYIEGDDYKAYEHKLEQQDQAEAVVNSFKY